MPIVSTFYGIIIRMHFRDHNPRHFHAQYQGFEAYFAIDTARRLAGDFPKSAEQIVRKWVLRHKPELLANWKLAQKDGPLTRIPGEEE